MKRSWVESRRSSIFRKCYRILLQIGSSNVVESRLYISGGPGDSFD